MDDLQKQQMYAALKPLWESYASFLNELRPSLSEVHQDYLNQVFRLFLIDAWNAARAEQSVADYVKERKSG